MEQATRPDEADFTYLARRAQIGRQLGEVMRAIGAPIVSPEELVRLEIQRYELIGGLIQEANRMHSNGLSRHTLESIYPSESISPAQPSELAA